MLVDPSEWLLRSAAGGTGVFAVTCLAMLAARQPALRQRLGEWGAAAALLVAALACGPAWLLVPSPWAADVQMPKESPASAAASESQGQGFEEAWVQTEATEEISVLPPSNDVSAELASHPLDRTAPTEADWPSQAVVWSRLLTVGPWLAIGYGLAAALLLMRWLWAHALLARLIRQSWPAPASVRRLTVALALPGSPVPEVRISASISVPLSCGLRRPAIVLPADFLESATDDDLRWALAHELAHIERRDAWGGLLLGLAQAVYCYSPFIWWVRRQVRLCREYVADAAAAEAGGPVEEYAQFLVRLASPAAVPAQALAITGKPSDLFRRVTMLLQCPQSIQRACPRRSFAALAGLVAIAVLASGLGLKAETPTAQHDKEPVAGQTYTVEVNVNDDQPAASDKQKELEEAKRALEEARKRLQKALGEVQEKHELLVTPLHDQLRKHVLTLGADGAEQLIRLRVDGGHMRLGIHLEPLSAVLADQLNLPSDQGIVIHNVMPDTPAAKAGLKDHDILLEFAGKPVPRDVGEFTKMIRVAKAGESFDAVVLRKGQKQTIKGIVLPEAKADASIDAKLAGPEIRRIEVKGLGEGRGEGLRAGPLFLGSSTPGSRSVMTTLMRSSDRFTARHQEGNLILTLTGTTAEGKARVSEIHVQDGEVSHTYKTVDEVPERYRDKVKHLLEMAEKGNTKVEVQTP